MFSLLVWCPTLTKYCFGYCVALTWNSCEYDRPKRSTDGRPAMYCCSNGLHAIPNSRVPMPPAAISTHSWPTLVPTSGFPTTNGTAFPTGENKAEMWIDAIGGLCEAMNATRARLSIAIKLNKILSLLTCRSQAFGGTVQLGPCECECVKVCRVRMVYKKKTSLEWIVRLIFGTFCLSIWMPTDVKNALTRCSRFSVFDISCVLSLINRSKSKIFSFWADTCSPSTCTCSANDSLSVCKRRSRSSVSWR